MPMSPRRSRKNADLAGTNLHTTGKYIYYKHPVTGKKIYMHGLTRDEAIRYALQANNEIKKQVNQLDHVPDLIDRFIDEYLPLKQYAPRTQAGILTKLKKIKATFNGVPLRNITVLTLKEYLEPFSPHSRKHNRLLWIDIYKYAMSEGLAEHNLAQRTLTKKLPTRQRPRLTLKQFNKIYSTSPEWFKIAMLAQLLILQRRDDLVNIKFSDYKNGLLTIIQHKTGTGLKITANDELEKLFRRAKQSGIASPYLLHKRPKKVRREYINKKQHWTQITPEILTREFKKQREKHGIKSPWYEIKSLGGRLLIDQGKSKEFVKKLMGHNRISTTEIYLGNGVKWEKAEAGLTIKL